MDTEAIIAKIKQYPIAVVGLVLSIIFGALIYFKWDTVEVLEKERDGVKHVLEDYAWNSRHSTNLVDNVSQVNGFVEEINKRVIYTENVVQNNNYFYRIGSVNKVEIESLHPGGESKEVPGLPDLKEFSSIDFKTKASGPVNKIFKFLHDVQNGKYFVRVDRFKIELSGSVDENPDRVNLSVDMSVLGVKTGK